MIGFVGTLSNDALMPVHQALFDSILAGDPQSRVLLPDAELQTAQTTLLTTAIAFANTAGGKNLMFAYVPLCKFMLYVNFFMQLT